MSIHVDIACCCVFAVPDVAASAACLAANFSNLSRSCILARYGFFFNAAFLARAAARRFRLALANSLLLDLQYTLQ
jgi:hypothetical protein